MPLTAGKHLRALADGNHIPLLGLGVWQIPNGPACVKAVRWSLELGYRHIDTAQAYGNEESVGLALKESGVPRDEVFITTKFWPGSRDPVAAAERSLGRLGLEYVDLYLIHWLQSGPTWAWSGMERAREKGYTRSIGVSNFDAPEMDQVIAGATVGRTPGQVLLRWCLQRNLIVIPKSSHRERIEENARVFDFTLSDPDMAELDALDETGATDRALEDKWW